MLALKECSHLDAPAMPYHLHISCILTFKSSTRKKLDLLAY